MSRLSYIMSFVVLPLAVCCMALTACDEISEADRIVADDSVGGGSNEPMAPTEVRRCVLIEDFTGQRCSNCPNAALEIEKIQQDVAGEKGGDSLIVVAIHCGMFSQTVTGKPLPLRTDTGNEYYNHWGVESQPAVRFSRTGSVIYSTNQYYGALNAVWPKSTPLALQIECSYDAATRKADVEVTGTSASSVSGLLQVWLTEDNIVAAQVMPDGNNKADYVHNHVFRASITDDIYGDAFAVSVTDEEAGGTSSATYSTTLDEAWQAAEVSVVAFVYNSAEGVVQVTKTRLIKPEEVEN